MKIRLKKPKNDFEFCEKICTLEGEIAMIEDELEHNRTPFKRKEYQSLLYEKRKQLTKVTNQYNNFILKHSNS